MEPLSLKCLASCRASRSNRTMADTRLTTGEYLVRLLGSCSVHAVELYRDLSAAKICHVTPRPKRNASATA